jgi:hypothetical protein
MDDVDRLTDNSLLENEVLVKIAAKEAAKIPAGEEGECSNCEEPSKRLVFGRCARCREGL